MESALAAFFGTCDRRRFEPSLVWAGISVDARFKQQLETVRVESFELPNGTGHGLRRLLRLSAVVALLRRQRPAIVHIHSCGAFSHSVLLAVARTMNIPVIRTMHIPYSRWPRNLASLRTPLRRAVQRLLSRMLARFVTVSSADREDMVRTSQFDAATCISIPNGISLAAYSSLPSNAEAKRRLGFEPDQLLIGAAGRLSNEKKFSRLIDAMPVLLKSHPNSSLIVFGEGPERERLQAQITSLGLGERVRLLGHRDDVPQCLAALDVCAIPSLYEAQGMVLLEAMAAGVPVVASDLLCFQEMVGQSGAASLLDTSDIVQLSAQLSLLLGDAALRARMGAAGKERAIGYSDLANAERVFGLYDELLLGRSR